MTLRHIMSDLSAIIIINKTKEAVMQDNNIEDDSSEVYVYLKRPFLFLSLIHI